MFKARLALAVAGMLAVGDCGYVMCGTSEDALQNLRRSIGSNLIKIKKDYPESKSIVYSTLDQLGRYHSLSKNTITKKDKYKRLYKKEQEGNKALKDEVSTMEKRVETMKKLIVEVNQKLKTDFVTVGELKEQRESFQREKEKFLQEKKQFEQVKRQLVEERDTLLRERDEMMQDKVEPAPARAKRRVKKPARREAYVQSSVAGHEAAVA